MTPTGVTRSDLEARERRAGVNGFIAGCLTSVAVVVILALAALLAGCGTPDETVYFLGDSVDAVPTSAPDVEWAPVAPGWTVGTMTYFKSAMRCVRKDLTPHAPRSCAYRWATDQPGVRVQTIRLYDGPELVIEWDATRKAWVVEPKGGKVLWGPALRDNTAETRSRCGFGADPRAPGDYVLCMESRR